MACAAALAAGAYAAMEISGSYLLRFARVFNCDPANHERGLFMLSCGDTGVSLYWVGALYFGIEEEAVENLRKADVIILGNSRTVRSFSTDAVSNFFKDNGISYFQMAQEGSGFRFGLEVLNAVHARPKAIVINSEHFYVDRLTPPIQQVVTFADAYRKRFQTFYYVKQFQRWACRQDSAILHDLFCSGRQPGQWRSAVNGENPHRRAGQYGDEGARYPVKMTRRGSLGAISTYLTNARTFVRELEAKDYCLILHLVPSPAAQVAAAQRIADDVGGIFLFPEVEGLYTYDNSHLNHESSERWSAAFVKELKPVLERCGVATKNSGAAVAGAAVP